MRYDSARRQRASYGRWARLYDLSTAFAALIYRFDDTKERQKAVERLALEPGQRTLEVGAGTGLNLPLIAEHVGINGAMVGLDVTRAMLRITARRLDRERIFGDLVEGDARHLPFPDDEFDAVLSFGGFNGLDNRKNALIEMMRVAKPGAKIVVADQGMSEIKRNTLLGRLFVRQDPWLRQEPPVDLLPDGARNVQVTHFRAENWYLIDFVNE
jgi:ubiquinone/menaquinone biosynthesis C-methylase UbiE